MRNVTISARRGIQHREKVVHAGRQCHVAHDTPMYSPSGRLRRTTISKHPALSSTAAMSSTEAFAGHGTCTGAQLLLRASNPRCDSTVLGHHRDWRHAGRSIMAERACVNLMHGVRCEACILTTMASFDRLTG